jgi:hypothetical protein
MIPFHILIPIKWELLPRVLEKIEKVFAAYALLETLD